MMWIHFQCRVTEIADPRRKSGKIFNRVRGKHAAGQISGRKTLMTNQGPGSIVEIGKKRVAHRFADELLARLVNVLAADLEKLEVIAKSAQSDQLIAGIARRHISHRVEPELAENGKEFVQIAIFKGLGLFVAGHRTGDIAQIGRRPE